MHGFSENVHEMVRSACDEVVDIFLKENNIDADHKMTFMERASLRSECRKLTKFLRLIDFVVVDTLRELATSLLAYAAAALCVSRCERSHLLRRKKLQIHRPRAALCSR